MEHGRQDTRAGGGDGVAQRNAGAVDVEVIFMGQVPLSEHGEHLGGEGFVEFNDVHIPQRHADLVHNLVDGGHGADAHGGRMATGYGPTAQVGHGGQAQLLEFILCHHQAHRGRIVLAAGVAGGNAAILHHRTQASPARPWSYRRGVLRRCRRFWGRRASAEC